MQCPCVSVVLRLQGFVLGSADGDQFPDHADVCLYLVVHQSYLLILFLGFADGFFVTINLSLYGLDSLPLQTVGRKPIT